MPIKYVCGKCGKEMTEDEYEEAASIIVEDGKSMNSMTIADDLCQNCAEVLVKLIKDTTIAPIPKE